MAATLLLDTKNTATYGPSASTTSINITLNTSGTNRMAVLSFYGATTVTSITGGGTWTKRLDSASSNYSYFQLWTCPLATQQTSVTVTVNFTSSGYQSVLLDTYYYASGAIPLYDTSNLTTGLSGATITGSITTTNSPATLVASGFGSGGANPFNFTAGTGYTLNNNLSNGTTHLSTASEIATSDSSPTGSYNASFNASPSISSFGAVGIISLYQGIVTNQEHFRLYADDAALNSATALAAEDTNYNVNTGNNYRLRIGFANTGAVTDSSFVPRLKYSKDGGAYTTVPTSDNGDGIFLVDSTWFTNGDATTNLLTNVGTFMAGQGLDTSASGSSFSFTTLYCTEYEWSLKFVSTNADGHTYTFRVYNSDNALNTYTQTPSIAPLYAVLNQEHFRIANDDAAMNSATWQAAEDVTSGIIEVGTNFRLRGEVANTGTGNSVGFVARLKYSKNGGAYTTVPTSNDGNGIYIINSTYFTNGDATTQQLTAVGTFTAGQGLDTSASASSMTLTASYNTEMEWNMVFTSDAIGNSYTFRMYNSDTAFNTYTITPTINPINWTSIGDVLYYDSSKFSPTPTFYLEGYFKTDNAIRPAYIRFYNNTDSTVVTNSKTSNATTTLTRERSAAITLTTGKEYFFQIGISKGGVMSYQGGKLIIQQ